MKLPHESSDEGVFWKRIDQFVRQQKRYWFAEIKRNKKVARKWMLSIVRALIRTGRYVIEHFWNLRKPVLRVSRRARKLRDQSHSYITEWRVEREIERIVSDSGPIIVGPWLSEVGFEILYWIPFLRWVKKAYNLPSERLVAVSRGGVDLWYSGVADTYIDVFDEITPEEFVRANELRSELSGTLKHFSPDGFDATILESVRNRLGVNRQRVLHPSLMYCLFRMFWSGHRPLGFLDAHTRHTRMVTPERTSVDGLPDRYAAVKFYKAKSLPDDPKNRLHVETIVEMLAKRMPVVVLDVNLNLDDHSDYEISGGSDVLSIRNLITPTPSTNLSVQTEIIAGAELFVGTCGSLAWLAPSLGVDSVGVYSDARFLHSHLYVARRVYHLMQGGTFSALDLNAIQTMGFRLGEMTKGRS